MRSAQRPDKVVGYLAEVADPEADLTVDYVHDEIHAVARVLDTEVSAVRRIVWQASHGRILSLLKDEDLLPADGPIEGPETSSSVWEFSPEPVAGRPFVNRVEQCARLSDPTRWSDTSPRWPTPKPISPST
ncbi:hypothetical protein CSW77_26240, partial [Shigella flexneri]